MKRRTFLLEPFAFAFGAMRLADVHAQEAPGKALVVYFSRTRGMPANADAVSHATPAVGNTALAAAAIAAELSADLVAIEVRRNYPADHRENSAIAKRERDADERPEFDLPSDFAQKLQGAQVVFLGYPIWWYQEPMVIRSFLQAYRQELKTKIVVPFCTSMAVDVDRSARNISKLLASDKVLEGRRFETDSADTPEAAACWARTVFNQCMRTAS